jgi:putative ABC transport system substrate-binding protein
MAIDIGRRQFISVLGGTAVAWPLALRAQQPERMRRVGVLMNMAEDNPEGQVFVAEFEQAMRQSGWTAGNMRIDVRWGANDVDLDGKFATELVALAPDVILASGTLSLAALLRVTRTLPIIFAQVSDPVGAGLVDNLARPGSNTTGFMNFEYSLSGKWLELLKQIAPAVTRVGVLRNPVNPAGIGQFSAVQGAAQSFGVEVSPINVHDAGEIKGAIGNFARSTNGGLIVTPSAGESSHLDLIIALAAQHRLPAVFADSYAVIGGGLASYGPDRIDQFRRAADYVDRVLKGTKPADLPVQAPTKYELLVNLKTAKALGLDVPATVLTRADKVIE